MTFTCPGQVLIKLHFCMIWWGGGEVCSASSGGELCQSSVPHAHQHTAVLARLLYLNCNCCSAVQTSDFSPPALAKKAAAPGKNFQLRQICENSKFNGNFTFQSGSTIFILTLRINISYYVCGKPTQYQCKYLLFH